MAEPKPGPGLIADENGWFATTVLLAGYCGFEIDDSTNWPAVTRIYEGGRRVLWCPYESLDDMAEAEQEIANQNLGALYSTQLMSSAAMVTRAGDGPQNKFMHQDTVDKATKNQIQSFWCGLRVPASIRASAAVITFAVNRHLEKANANADQDITQGTAAEIVRILNRGPDADTPSNQGDV